MQEIRGGGIAVKVAVQSRRTLGQSDRIRCARRAGDGIFVHAPLNWNHAHALSQGSTTPAPAVPAVVLAATIVGQRAGRLARIISFRGRAALKSQSAKHQDDDVLHAAFETAISYGEETTNCFAALSQLAVCLFPSQSRNWSEIVSAGSVPVARIRKWSPFQVAIRGELFQPK